MGCGRGTVGTAVRGLLAMAVAALVALFAVSPSLASAASTRTLAASAQCSSHVAFQLIDVTTSGCLEEVSAGRWETSNTVSLNGVSLTPAAGTRLVVEAPTATSPGGRLSVRTDINVEGVKFDGGQLNWNLPAGGRGDEKQVVSTGNLNGQKLLGFDISGSAEIRIGWDAKNDLHYVKFKANLALPSVFKNGPEEKAGGLTATVGLRVDPLGVHADTVKAEVSNAYIGTLQVKHLCLSFVGAGSSTAPCSPPSNGAEPLLTCENPGNVDRWDGSAEIVLPTADKPSIGVWAGVQNGMFSYAGGQASHLGTSVPIATGVYLDRVGLALCVTPPPIKFKGAMGITIGPHVGGTAPVAINGSIEYVDSRPWLIKAAGDVELFGYRVADGFISYRSDNTIDFGFHAALDFKIASVEASLSGWIEARNPFRFNVDGSGKVCVLSVACLSGEVTASSEGLAACITVLEGDVWEYVKNADWEWWALWRSHWELRHWRLRAGAGVHWSTGKVDLMGDSCDVSPFRAVKSASAAAVSKRTVHVGAGATALTLEVKGQGDAPALRIVGPDGTRYDSPKKAAIVPGREMIARDPRTKATDVMIAHPAAGKWRIEAEKGDKITSVSRATVDPVAHIDAGVGGKGEHRVLGYSYQPEPDHTTRFVEEGANYEQELGVAHGKTCGFVKHIHPHLPECGDIHFTPAAGPAGTRRIYAVTTMNGEVTDKRLVATYDAPREPMPEEIPELDVRRVPGGISIGFKPSKAPIRAAKAIDYNVDINLSDGRRLLDVLPRRDHRVIVRDIPASVKVKVSVAPLRSDDTQGRMRTVELAPGAIGAVSQAHRKH
jgi:hypothetical protein